MTRKVAHPQVRVPTDLWSGLHLSKSADFEALKKNEVCSRYFPTHLTTLYQLLGTDADQTKHCIPFVDFYELQRITT